MRKVERGFTLIELMIVVAVIAVLSAIAYPSYQEYVTRSRRVEAQSLLNEAAARQERWRAQNGTYMTSSADADIAKLKLPYGARSEHGYYTLEIADDPSGYLLTAKRDGTQAADNKCGNFTLNAAGKKDMVADTPGTVQQCWR